MKDLPEIPRAGYTLERVFFPEQILTLSESSEGLPENPTLQVGWDWRLSNLRRFEVILHLELGASRKRLDGVKLTAIAVFSGSEETPSANLTDFVRLQGPAILLPFMREAISSLTARGPYGVFYLPAINVVHLMRDMDPEHTTGAQQLRSGERLPGITPESEPFSSESEHSSSM